MIDRKLVILIVLGILVGQLIASKILRQPSS